jgi:hypothetical protein
MAWFINNAVGQLVMDFKSNARLISSCLLIFAFTSGLLSSVAGNAVTDLSTDPNQTSPLF